MEPINRGFVGGQEPQYGLRGAEEASESSNNFQVKKRVVMWNTETRKKIGGAAAPFPENLQSYLARNVHLQVYKGQDCPIGWNENSKKRKPNEAVMNPALPSGVMGPGEKVTVPTGCDTRGEYRIAGTTPHVAHGTAVVAEEGHYICVPEPTVPLGIPESIARTGRQDIAVAAAVGVVDVGSPSFSLPRFSDQNMSPKLDQGLAIAGTTAHDAHGTAVVAEEGHYICVPEPTVPLGIP